MKNRKLDEIAKISSGGTPSRNKSEYFSHGTVLWVKSGELQENLIFDTEEKLTLEALKNSSAKVVPAGTVLLALYGANVGRVGLLGLDASTNQAVATIQCKSDVLFNKYLFYFLMLNKDKLIDRAAGGAQQNISQAILSELDIPLPSLAEQRRIAQILDQADRLRRLRRHARQLTDTFLQSVFIEMFEDLTRFDSIELGDELHKIESGWSPVCDEAFTTSNQWGVLSLSAVSNGRYSDKDVKALPLSQAPKEHLEVKPRDFLVTRKNTKELVGACAIVHRTCPMVMIPDTIFRFQLKQEKILPEYLWGLFNENLFRKKIQSMATGSAGSMPNISKEKLGELRIPAPPLHLQKQFAKILNAVETQTTIEREAERQAELNFQALLHRAFAGQLLKQPAWVGEPV